MKAITQIPHVGCRSMFIGLAIYIVAFAAMLLVLTGCGH